MALAELRVLEEEMQMLNAVLLPKGVALALLRTDAQRALLYLYRTSTLFQELQREEVRAFLRQWGYQRFSLEEALAHLRERVAAAGSFPHEIGVFLGYPLSDVQEFIRSAGGIACLAAIGRFIPTRMRPGKYLRVIANARMFTCAGFRTVFLFRV